MITRTAGEMTGRVVPSGNGRLTAGLATTAIMLALLVGCTTGQDQTPATGPTGTGAGSTDPQLQSLLLTAADLPNSYSLTTELDDTGTELLTNCPAMSGSTEPAAQARVAFIDPAGASLGEDLQRRASVDDARATMAELAGVPDTCGTFSAELTGRPELSGVEMQIAITAADPPPVGDEQVGLRMSVSLHQQPIIEQYQYVIRSGDLIIVVFQTSPPLGRADAELASTVAEAAYRKATGT